MFVNHYIKEMFKTKEALIHDLRTLKCRWGHGELGRMNLRQLSTNSITVSLISGPHHI